MRRLPRGHDVSSHLNVILVTAESGEVFEWIFDDHPWSIRFVLEQAAEFAGDPDVAFTWYDAGQVDRLMNVILECRGG